MEQESLIKVIQESALPLESADHLDPLLEAIGDSRVVLLGEASHGTSEFYTWRTELSKRLIKEKGFRFIAVEGDWPACYSVNRWVRGLGEQDQQAGDMLLKAFERWPQWMWANREVEDLVQWMREWNLQAAPEEQVGFYGLDVYSLWESMDELQRYLSSKGDPSSLEAAEAVFRCFRAYGRDEQKFAVSAAYLDSSCEDEAVQLLQELRKHRQALENASGDMLLDSESAFDAELNALAVVNAEHYYRTMVGGDAESWNIRDRHMVEVLERLLERMGESSKAIVWEHNTHIGDARATDMEADGMVNVGQLVRESGISSYAVGFSTYRGAVLAGTSWGSLVQQMPVPEAWKNSWEDFLHRASAKNKLFLFGEGSSGMFEEVLGHRAIGVVYRPNREWGNYVPTSLANRYNALLYLEETTALRPLGVPQPLALLD